ncbi:transglutaminase family protein [Candidatus Thiothrix sp. Deng01]|uniref:Transglutaminase family protein n=1 Tax=Candidatus Thiothrix phosphatis TaxID=3112415 RepID=A0ABU6CY58_9GAMM|nr:transglutaminase family protein [Candidatus Thiothrix sp. Deng01]MEB4591776.1 transglutaminase family protein [Candidatus Thiothrix sp. Deng01]
MSIHVALNHRTVYKFDRPVNLSPHVVRLRPAMHSRTPIMAYTLKIKPEKHFLNWQQDPFGNWLGRLVFPDKVTELSVEVDLVADMVTINPFDFFVEDYAHEFPFTYKPELKRELEPYLEVDEDGELLQEWLKGVDFEQPNTVMFLVALNHRLQQDIGYNIRMEPGVQTCEETLTIKRGSCRDTAWLLVQILRHLGLAARFVSGYLVQLTADQKSLDGPSGPEADFTDLHAWTEVYLPGAGWVGLDPTSGLFAGEGHIPLACTPKPGSAAPIDGMTDKCEVEFEFSNTVTRIHEDPRVTKPYSDEQWDHILALGNQVENDLIRGDVRLTMGGEPTFVSIDDMESPQWNSAALGEHKRALAGDLLRRMQRVFSNAGSVLQFGQGKWYPGEPFPRWALACFWRVDGLPVWKDQSLIADDQKDYGFGDDAAKQFAETLCRNVGLHTRYLVPGYEDRLYYLWKEANQPANIDWLTLNLRDSKHRNDLVLALQHGLDTPTGYALPLRWDYFKQGWASAPWAFRRENMYLVPGNSPMGFRMPLDSLPWSAEDERDIESQPCPFEDRPPLPDFHGEVEWRYRELVAPPEPQPQHADSRPQEKEWRDVPRTAMCIQAREGRLHVFLPPLSYLEHYLALVANIEKTAAELNMPVLLEGYEPPSDPRMKSFKVTPDPGVIEVNIHPAAHWQELVSNTEVLYEEARQARLGTEKFMLDGRHTGTGGGNHVTLGSWTPGDSPFLRQPDLLRSLLTFWQHHPGLSYLFSGMFIGPTSQAPRVDEARDEALYELEIAFQQMPSGYNTQPWLVDRLLRNLLIDVTGNTHRAEFCIDKMYSPDSFSGRQGLLEFRAFEMPPHARMSVVQMLLLRTLVARFWSMPYKHRLVRWGTELHDRWMLPYYVWEDMRDVCEDLQLAGYPFQQEWFAPFHEFRFPVYGRVQYCGIQLELRAALEPWNVLGEELSNMGTARFVDSSIERVQVRITGLTDSRYVVACNGRRVPMNATGVQGEYVAGVRYRAWQPPSALHPTIGIHSPLVFDIIDTWTGRSIGGCTYHVVHPGGRSYDTFPVNAYEAEGRRFSRFREQHTPGMLEPKFLSDATRQFYTHPARPMAPPPEETNADYPYTLDLRRM